MAKPTPLGRKVPDGGRFPPLRGRIVITLC